LINDFVALVVLCRATARRKGAHKEMQIAIADVRQGEELAGGLRFAEEQTAVIEWFDRQRTTATQ
jgi:hypothetical protein